MSTPVATDPGLDVARIRADFPILEREIGTNPLVYLDSAATSQKPRAVVDAVDAYYATSNANVHRGVHTLGNEADVYKRQHPDRVHVLHDGRVVTSGGADLAREIEREGYEPILGTAAAATA